MTVSRSVIICAVNAVVWCGDIIAAPAFRLNSIGYLPGQLKQATLAADATRFMLIRDSDGVEVFSGTVTGPITNADTRERLFTADFSTFTNAGLFRLDAPGAGSSAPFQIGEGIYREPFRTVTRAMYLWRCGAAVSGTYNGDTFAHEVCHTNDAWLDFVGGVAVHSNANGGWHDAGDYNKYVVNAGVTVGCMLRAWEDYRPAIERVRLDLPERGGPLPEFLAEIKWELDWLLKMQAADGSVYHKVSTRNFGGFILPELETTPRYFAPWSSAATADFVAMLAAGARHFREFDAAFAERCLAAAMRSQDFLATHPDNHRADLSSFTTGTYQTRDDDDRIWALAELWAATGNTNHLRDFEARVRGRFQTLEAAWDWGNVSNLGLLTYLFSTREGRDASLVEALRTSLLTTANKIVLTRNEHGYARPLGTSYSWGGNGTVARQTLILAAAYRISQNREYRQTALDALSYLFGRNPFGRSFVTGLGVNPPQHPHDRRSGGDQVAQPWPGYLVGGPNPGATDWHDEQEDFRTNEIAINWNGALIYALAAFLD